MRRYRYETVDVFTTERFGGNPLAVVLDADGLADMEMQALAAEFNYSETTFVLSPENPAHTAKVRIFNRTYEMPFAGHPNVGTAFVLAQARGGNRFTFEEKAGLVHVDVVRNASGSPMGAVIDAPQALSLGPEPDIAAVAACAGLAASDIVARTHRPVVASVGVTFLIAEVEPPSLSRATPDPLAFRTLLDATPEMRGRLSLFLYAPESEHRVRARMFSPIAGTWEDPATGSANAALAALRLSLSTQETLSFSTLQGVEMGRPSLLELTAHRGADGACARVGGACVPVFRGEAIV